MLKIRNRFARIAVKTLAYFTAIVLLLFTGLSIYVSINKDKILSGFKDTLNKNIKGKLSYSEADITIWKHFPFIGLHIYDVKLTDSLNIPLLEMKEAAVKVSLLQYFNNKTSLRNLSAKNGYLHIITDTSGYTNKYLLQSQKKEKDTTKGGLELNHASLKNVRVILENRQKNKRYNVLFKDLDAKIKTSGDEIKIDLKQESLIEGLGFNLDKGSFLKKQTFKTNIDLRFNKKTEVLSFDETKVYIANHPYFLKGIFRLEETGSFVLDINTTKAPFNNLRNIFAEKTANNIKDIQFEKPIDVTAKLEGSLAYRSIPKITASWKVKDNNLTTPVATLSNVSFAGSFSNEIIKGQPMTDENSGATLRSFKGNWDGIALSGDNITINNLVNPYANMSFQSSTDLKALNNKLGLSAIQFISGKASVNFHYEGLLSKDISLIDKLNGRLVFSGATINYIPRNFTFNNCSGNILFSEDRVEASNMKFELGSNKFTVNVLGSNLSGLSADDAGKATIQCNVYTPSLNVAELKSVFSNRKRVAAKAGSGKLISAASKVDAALDHGRLQLQLNAGAVHFNNFHGTDLKGTVLFSNEDLLLNNVAVSHANGKLIINADIKNTGNQNRATAKVNLQNVDVSKVFKAFDDFGQDGISHANIKGLLNANTSINLLIGQNGNLIPGTINGTVDFSLKKGSLINYEPMQNIKSFVFKNRDMSNISFAELKNKFSINNFQVTIPRMEIQSSAIALFVEGLYDMKKTASKIDIQVPLKGLKKRDSSYVPTNIGVDAKAGTSVYLEGKNDKTGKVKFKLNTSRTIRKLF
jgi:hypothetical protein